MNVLVFGAQIVALTSAALLAVAIAHKVHVVRVGRANEEPVFRLRWLRPSWALPVLIAGAIGEAALISLLFLRPAIGLAAVATLMLAYAAVLYRLPADEPCGCFGEIIPMTNRMGFWRNLTLLTVAGSASPVAINHDLRTHFLTQATVGSALVVLAAIAGLTWAMRTGSFAGVHVNQRIG